MTAQRELPVPEIETLCVLAHVSEARLTLRGHNEREIFALIDAGYLLAWNIALKPSKMSRELRILPESIEHYKRTGKPWPTHALSGSVVQTLLRGGLDKKPFLYSPTIALILNCKDTTVTNLIDSRALSVIPHPETGLKYRRGPNGAACVPLQSFLDFMKIRMEGIC